MLSQNFTFVDVETTGADARTGRVIEIGIVRVEKGEVVQVYETLLNPGYPLPEFITKLTGIKDKDLKKAPTFEEVKDEVLELFRDSMFVAHNVAFDYTFLKQEFKRVDYGFNSERMCTVKLSRSLYPQYKRHNLTEIINRFEFTCKRRHRALDDAKVLWDFLNLVENKFSKPELYAAMVKSITKTRKQSLSKGLLTYTPVFE